MCLPPLKDASDFRGSGAVVRDGLLYELPTPQQQIFGTYRFSTAEKAPRVACAHNFRPPLLGANMEKMHSLSNFIYRRIFKSSDS